MNKHVKNLADFVEGVFTCYEQYELATALAANLGYELKSEDERKKNTIEELAQLIIEASKNHEGGIGHE